MAKLREVDVAADERPFELVWADPTSLDANPLNWKIHTDFQTEVVSDLIERHGWVKPLVYNRVTSRLLDGHDRREIALGQGMPFVPVVVGDWAEEQEAEILATLDPSAALSRPDPAALAKVMARIRETSPALGTLMAQMQAGGGVAGWIEKAKQKRPETETVTFQARVNDPNAEWQGMPECENQDARPYRSIIVHFKSEDDVREFADLIGQVIGDKGKWIWFPKHDPILWSKNPYVSAAGTEVAED